MLNKPWPSKILLLGEYTILSGSKALAFPFETFSGKWAFDGINNESHKILCEFVAKDWEQFIDVQRMRNDLDKGLWFNSSIPHGYGLGSSGALIAAIFQTYGKDCPSLLKTKEILARMEDYFHGSSSGIDPLVSYLGRPLLIHNFKEVEVLERRPELKGFFLVNTNRPRQTGALVEVYQEKLKDPQFKRGCAEILSRDVDFAIENILQNHTEHLFHHLWHISKFQWDFFSEMIPHQMRGLWTTGLESGDYILKLCGAGGGGYLLAHSEKLSVSQLQDLFDSHDLRELK